MAERIPRASVSVRFFGDEDTLAMFALGATGERAVLMFIQLLVLAKDLRNGGTFASPIEVYAARLGMTPKKTRECYAILSRPGVDWLEQDGDGFRIRSWEKYNDESKKGWGGKRRGAGRKTKVHQPEPLKLLARATLTKAVQSGLIVRPNFCESCGEASSDIEGHHADYTQPLKVDWLCTKCHGGEHRVVGPNNQLEYSRPIKTGQDGCASVSVTDSERERQQNTHSTAGEDSLVEHVSKCVAASMRLAGGLRHEKREPAMVAERVSGWRKLGTVVIHGQSVSIDEVIRRAADRCAESELAGRASGCLGWMDTVIDSSVRGEVWPGEFRESSAKPLVPAAKPRVIYQPKGAPQ